MALINISRFIDEERPYFEATEAIISMDDEELLHPDNYDRTINFLNLISLYSDSKDMLIIAGNICKTFINGKIVYEE